MVRRCPSRGADEPDRVLGCQATDGAGGVDAGEDPALWVEDEAGCLEVDGVWVDEGARESGDLVRVRIVTDRKRQFVLLDEGRVVASSSTDIETTDAPISSRASLARSKPRS